MGTTTAGNNDVKQPLLSDIDRDESTSRNVLQHIFTQQITVSISLTIYQRYYVAIAQHKSFSCFLLTTPAKPE
jgi:hypothetical protein